RAVWNCADPELLADLGGLVDRGRDGSASGGAFAPEPAAPRAFAGSDLAYGGRARRAAGRCWSADIRAVPEPPAPRIPRLPLDHAGGLAISPARRRTCRLDRLRCRDLGCRAGKRSIRNRDADP